MAAEHSGFDTMLVSWTPPPAPPAAGYLVRVTGARTTVLTATGNSQIISVNNQFGVYSIRVMSLSLHLPGEASVPVEITVRGITQI